MEIKTVKVKLGRLIFKEAHPFVEKREINWPFILKFMGFLVVGTIIGILFLPTPTIHDPNFHEAADPGSISSKPSEELESIDYLHPENPKKRNPRTSGSFDYLSPGQDGAKQSTTHRNGPMVLARSGFDAKNQLPPGTRVPMKLIQKANVSTQAMPVIAKVTSDVYQEDYLAIPEGAQFLGEISFDDTSGRAQVTWRNIHLPDGRERQISALATSLDGQIGVEGNIHSDSFKNTAGSLASRFISAFAEGSMAHGPMGASPGGSQNGLKNAIAETARDRGEAWADELKKQKKWIEIGSDQSFLAVLSQPFTFRDPGTLYGQ